MFLYPSITDWFLFHRKKWFLQKMCAQCVVCCVSKYSLITTVVLHCYLMDSGSPVTFDVPVQLSLHCGINQWFLPTGWSLTACLVVHVILAAHPYSSCSCVVLACLKCCTCPPNPPFNHLTGLSQVVTIFASYKPASFSTSYLHSQHIVSCLHQHWWYMPDFYWEFLVRCYCSVCRWCIRFFISYFEQIKAHELRRICGGRLFRGSAPGSAARLRNPPLSVASL